MARSAALRSSLVAIVLGLAMTGGAGLARRATALSGPHAAPPQSAIASPPCIDVVVTGRDIRPTDAFEPKDFVVTVNGQARRVIEVRHVSRGPGAASAAASRARSNPGAVFASEPVRTILVAVDQALLRRGEERAITQAAGALLDRLGLEDLVGVVRLPLPRAMPVAFNTDRPAARDALRAVTGLMLPGGAFVAADAPRRDTPDRAAAGDPDRATGGEPDRSSRRQEEAASRDMTSALPTAEVERADASAVGLLEVLKSLQGWPGRKTLALFSTGLPDNLPVLSPRIDALTRAAAAARAVVYVFAYRQQGEDRQPRDFSLLEALAAGTGGTLTYLDRNPAKTVDRVLPELSACYVLRLEGVAADDDGRPRTLRVQTARKGASVRSQAFLVARADRDDPVASAPAAESVPAADSRGRTDARANEREAELRLAVSRLGEYADAYQRNFSALVAEESYVQYVSGRERNLRSDFLLVHLDDSNSWISFRDVFEVNGRPVRDRDERLKKLFLENPSGEAIARMQAVQDESARYNTGDVERNINVPLFPLKIARSTSQARFHFRLAGRRDTQGVPTWRLEYEERIRPTMVKNPRTGGDVPLSGWFVIDAGTGAIVESGMEARDVDVRADFVVRYRNDAGLGLWVPSEMTETYDGRPDGRLVMRAKATYSNFRRFQVKTEEKIAIPK